MLQRGVSCVFLSGPRAGASMGQWKVQAFGAPAWAGLHCWGFVVLGVLNMAMTFAGDLVTTLVISLPWSVFPQTL